MDHLSSSASKKNIAESITKFRSVPLRKIPKNWDVESDNPLFLFIGRGGGGTFYTLHVATGTFNSRKSKFLQNLATDRDEADKTAREIARRMGVRLVNSAWNVRMRDVTDPDARENTKDYDKTTEHQILKAATLSGNEKFTPEDVERFARAEMKKNSEAMRNSEEFVSNKLTQNQKKTLWEYGKTRSADINKLLLFVADGYVFFGDTDSQSVGSTTYETDDLSELWGMIDDLDVITNDPQNALAQKAVVYSGLGVGRSNAINEARIGDHVSFPAFTSTSIDPSVAEGFTKSRGADTTALPDSGSRHSFVTNIVVFELPKGFHKGIFGGGSMPIASEQEYILARAQAFELTNRRFDRAENILYHYVKPIENEPLEEAAIDYETLSLFRARERKKREWKENDARYTVGLGETGHYYTLRVIQRNPKTGKITIKHDRNLATEKDEALRMAREIAQRDGIPLVSDFHGVRNTGRDESQARNLRELERERSYRATRHHTEIAASMPEEWRDAIKSYTDWSLDINATLINEYNKKRKTRFRIQPEGPAATGKPRAAWQIHEIANMLSNALLDPRNALQDKVVTYSGIGKGLAKELRELGKGDEVTFPAFTSTSLDLIQSVSFAEAGTAISPKDQKEFDLKPEAPRHVLVFRLPKGYHRGMYVNDISEAKGEDEFIIAKNSRFRLVDKRFTHRSDEIQQWWGEDVASLTYYVLEPID